MVENYILEEVVGEGQFGKVYRACHKLTGKVVAIKVVRITKFKENPKLEECTVNEIRTLSKVEDNTHIVQFIELLRSSNNYYFVYDFCAGGTLEDLLRAHTFLPEQNALIVFKQLVDAFRVLRKADIMHRDLKPTNILLHGNTVKLADFGFCKPLSQEKQMANTMLGSPLYMAPEVLRGQDYGAKADIWSLGVVFFELLFGFCPFEEKSIASLINLLEEGVLVIPRHIQSISQQTEALLHAMLVKDPSNRVSWEEIFSVNISDEGTYISQPRYHPLSNPPPASLNEPLLSPIIISTEYQQPISVPSPRATAPIQAATGSIEFTPSNYFDQQTKQYSGFQSNNNQVINQKETYEQLPHLVQMISSEPIYKIPNSIEPLIPDYRSEDFSHLNLQLPSDKITTPISAEPFFIKKQEDFPQTFTFQTAAPIQPALSSQQRTTAAYEFSSDPITISIQQQEQQQQQFQQQLPQQNQLRMTQSMEFHKKSSSSSTSTPNNIKNAEGLSLVASPQQLIQQISRPSQQNPPNDVTPQIEASLPQMNQQPPPQQATAKLTIIKRPPSMPYLAMHTSIPSTLTFNSNTMYSNNTDAALFNSKNLNSNNGLNSKPFLPYQPVLQTALQIPQTTGVINTTTIQSQTPLQLTSITGIISPRQIPQNNPSINQQPLEFEPTKQHYMTQSVPEQGNNQPAASEIEYLLKERSILETMVQILFEVIDVCAEPRIETCLSYLTASFYMYIILPQCERLQALQEDANAQTWSTRESEQLNRISSAINKEVEGIHAVLSFTVLNRNEPNEPPVQSVGAATKKLIEAIRDLYNPVEINMLQAIRKLIDAPKLKVALANFESIADYERHVQLETIKNAQIINITHYLDNFCFID